MLRHPSDSAAQRDAEDVALQLIAAQLGLPLRKRRLPLPDGGWLEVDGASDSPRVLCEIWAHQGAPKSAQKAKVMTDAMKLVYARSLLAAPNQACRMLFVFTDPRAAAHFRGRSWMAGALAAAGIETAVVELPAPVREAIEAAQELQYR